MNEIRKSVAWLFGLGLVIGMAAWPAMAQPLVPAEVKAMRQPQFDIDYQLGDSRATTVELWYTDDGSQSWKLYGVDADRVSPISFTAPRQGLYGFLVIARNKHGASAPNPTAGTAPTFWCFVDWHRPQVQITGPATTPSPDGAGDWVVLPPGAPLPIRYTALDDNMVDKPIRIEYRLANDIQWRQIVADSPNTGQYDWHVPDAVRGPFLLRVTAVDKAGNVGVASTLREMEIRRQTHAPRPAEPMNDTDRPTGSAFELPRIDSDSGSALPPSRLPDPPAAGLIQPALPSGPPGRTVAPAPPAVVPEPAPVEPSDVRPSTVENALIEPLLVAEHDALGLFVLHYTCAEPMSAKQLDPVVSQLQSAMVPLVKTGQLVGPIGVTLTPARDSLDLIREVRLYAVVAPHHRRPEQVALIAPNVEKNIGKLDGFIRTQFEKLVEASPPVGEPVATGHAHGRPAGLASEQPARPDVATAPAASIATGAMPQPDPIARPRPAPDDPTAVAAGRQNVQIELGPSKPELRLQPADPPAPVPHSPGIVGEPPSPPARTPAVDPLAPSSPPAPDGTVVAPATGHRPETAIIAPPPASPEPPAVAAPAVPSAPTANVQLPAPTRIEPAGPAAGHPTPTIPPPPVVPAPAVSGGSATPASPAPTESPLAGASPTVSASGDPAPTVRATVSPPPVAADRQAVARELFRTGVAAQAANDQAKAVEAYAQAIAEDPNLVEAYINLAGLQMLAKQYDLAEGNYSRAVGLDSTRYQALFGLGSVQLLQRNPRAAQQTLSRLVQVRGTDAAAWVLYGDACIGVKETGKAVAAWQEAVRLSPSTQVGQIARERLAKYGGR